MKTRNIGKSIALLALLTSCSTEELTTNATPTPGQQVTITASLGSSTDTDKPGTRMSYDENTVTEVGGLLTKWTEGDAFNIVPFDESTGEDVEGTPQTFTLDATSAGKTEGTFTGTAPTASSQYRIYYPASITTYDEFDAFSYTGQVQTGNGDKDHLTNYHSIIVKTKADYTKIEFSGKGFYQSSCMKFVLTLPGDGNIVPKTITLATADGSTRFYETNRGDGILNGGDIASLSMGLKGITLTGTERTITAYMMMSCQSIGLPSSKDITVTVNAEDGSSYSQFITIENDYPYLQLEGGMMHTIIAKNMKKVEPSNVMKFKVKITDADKTFSTRPGGLQIRRI